VARKEKLKLIHEGGELDSDLWGEYYSWEHFFFVDDTEKIVSPIFKDRIQAMRWKKNK